MIDPRNIAIADFTYDLPDNRIALHPLPRRDASKLLIYQKGRISEDVYSNIADYIPSNSLLVFNNTKVINARIRFQKSTGSVIEIFCLEPYELVSEYSTVMNLHGKVRWKCFVGGMAKWKSGLLEKEITIGTTRLQVHAELIEKITDAYVIEISWTPERYTFSEIIEAAGDIPLPPYIKRNTDVEDTDRYQTIYAKHDGSVAAPTAGLHFTENIFSALHAKNIATTNITLHVGAGTFKPVKAATMEGHEMHAEWIDVSLKTIEQIQKHAGDIVAVGTTSARTLETLYWLGVKCMHHPNFQKLELKQWDVYDKEMQNTNISTEEALNAFVKWLKKNEQPHIFTQTQLMIVPGYRFRIIQGLITNFHQPQSTLLLLVAAATNNNWKHIYEYALTHEFRFLSYGDGNLIWIDYDQG